MLNQPGFSPMVQSTPEVTGIVFPGESAQASGQWVRDLLRRILGQVHGIVRRVVVCTHD